MRGYLPGTSPFPPGNPFAESGAPTVEAPPATPVSGTAPINVPIASSNSGAWLNVPAPYNWNGVGTAPAEVVAVFQALAAAVGEPATTDPNELGEVWGNVWQMVTTGEACNISPATLSATVTQAAPQGPQAVAYAIQQLMLQSPCAGVIQHPISPPAAPPVVYPPGGVSTTPPATTTPRASSVPWGWILGGAGILTVAGIAIFMVSRKKKRENPCACGNPSVNPGVMALTTPFRAVNPSAHREAAFDGVSEEFFETDVEPDELDERENPKPRKRRKKR